MRSLFNIIKSSRVDVEESVVIGSRPLEFVEESDEDATSLSESDEQEVLDQLERKIEETEHRCREMLDKAQSEANILLENAQKESEEYRKAVETEMKRTKKEKELAGFEQGFEKGYTESLNKYRELIEDAKSIVTDAERYKVDTVNSMEGGIVELVTASVEKIVRRKLDEDDEILLHVIKGAMESLTHRDQISIKVSMEDLDYVNMTKDRLLAQFPGIKTIDINVDDSFRKGDLEIESESGTVNPSITHQIKKLTGEFDKLFSNEELI